MLTNELIDYLNDYLRIDGIGDYKDAYNGLQVEGAREVTKIAIAVDACKYTIQAAVDLSAQMLLVHHGLFWGIKAPITGNYYQRLALLIKNDLALYSCHLPLDAHLEVGNNHVLIRRLGLEAAGNFAEFEGVPLGVVSETSLALSVLLERVRETLEIDPFVIAKGPSIVKRLGVITGGGSSFIAEAASRGIDTLLTGEGPHHSYFDAEEYGMNVIYAGHYATETVGVKALGAHLTERFGIDCLFIHHPTGL